jgi:hypothetical protein
VTDTLSTRIGKRVSRGLRGLGPNDRLAAMGAAAIFASLLLPWYGAPIASDLVQTGFGAFNFSTAAMLLTAGSALFLLLEVGRGYRPPRPLTVGGLLIAAGVWAGLLVMYQMADRPVFDSVGIQGDYGLRYGIFVAFAGAAVITLAGAQRRHYEHAGHAAHADDDLEDLDGLEGEDDDE